MNDFRSPARVFCALAIVALSTGLSAAPADDKTAAAETAPPPARTVDVVDHAFGLTLPDPYRWMEGKDNAEFQAWLKAQGDFTRQKLDTMPTLDSWQTRLNAASAKGVAYRSLIQVADRLFYVRSQGSDTGTLMVRDASGKDHVLFAPATLDNGKGKSSITTFSVSPDASKVAVNIDRGGNEITRIEVLDVATGKFTGDAVEPVWGEFKAHWLPDGSAFTYTQMQPAVAKNDPMQSMRVRLHKLHADAKDDSVLLTAGGKDNTRFSVVVDQFPDIDPSQNSAWAIATATNARLDERLCVAPRKLSLKPAAPWRCIAEYADGVRDAVLHGDALYLLSTHDNSNGRVLAIDLADPKANLASAREVIAMSNESVATNLQAAHDTLYVLRANNGYSEILRVDYASGKSSAVKLPFAGTVTRFIADPRGDGFVSALEFWNRPSDTFRYIGGLSKNLALSDFSPIDYSAVSTTETEATSLDQTKVPLTILHLPDTKLDGGNRAVVFGYGGYGQSMTPFFNATLAEWVRAGNVLAICHVRGGGEKGESWHRAGQGINKRKGVEDFVACADELAKLHYSRTENTALVAGSMGGLIVGGAVANYPQKFGAAIIMVGMLNPVRLLEGINGANQIGEVGDPRTSDGMKALAAMDPYQHIRADVSYPAVMLSVGLNDSRVSTWETGKFAAQLRKANTSQKPIWIRTDAESGHGANSSDDAAKMFADIYTFLDAELPGRTAAPATSAPINGNQQP